MLLPQELSYHIVIKLQIKVSNLRVYKNPMYRMNK